MKTATTEQPKVKKKYQKLPWVGYNMRHGDAPFSIRTWYPDAKSGRVAELQCEYNCNFDPMASMPGQPPQFRIKEIQTIDESLRLDFDKMKAVFKASHDGGKTLMAAAVQVIGEDNLSPAWLDKARKATKIYGTTNEPR